MLKMLQRIVQEINAAHDFSEALQIMVKRVRQAVEAQACTVFLINERSKEYVLMATDGLKPESVGTVKLGLDEGLVGLVGQREEPINLEHAPSHPKFSARSEVGEEVLQAFLGVPIIHRRTLHGVLMVQQKERRRFDEAEEAFLVTISAQIAGVIAHADATGVMAALFDNVNQIELKTPEAAKEEICFEGIPSSPGVGIGTAVVVYPLADLKAVPDRTTEDIDKEIQLFQEALQAARDDIKALGERLAPSLPESEKELFDVYLRILDGSGLGKEVCDIIQTGQWAQGALRKVIDQHVRQFEGMEDPYLRERAADIRDLGQRVLSYLQESQRTTPYYPEQTILIGDEVSASDLASIPEGKLVGLLSVRGSSNSHVAILARALGIPAVMGVDGFSALNCPFEGSELIVDGYYGQVYVSPSPELRQGFVELAEEERELDISLSDLHDQPAVTPDGQTIALFVNAGLAADASLSLSVGAEGVGLYRTEMTFMTRDSFPAEEEQRIIYRQLLNAFSPRPVIMRTLDIGGDKILPYFPIEEANPSLGWRGIRITLDHPDVFLVQLRAMLRASEGFDNLRIMFPMIASLSEVDDAIVLLNQAYDEVKEEGAEIIKPPIGVMVEVPSAVYMVRQLAQRVDFLSVGSNDLTQYILAVDRTNSRVASLYDWLHPAVISALIQIVEGIHSQGKQVSLCGEMASDPAAVILLLAIGFDALSMSSVSLPRMKWIVRNFTMKRARELLEEVLFMENPGLIRFHLEQALDQAGLGGLIRAGKS